MRQLVKHGFYSSIANCGTKIPARFSRHIWNFLAVLRNLYLLAARILAKPLNDVQRKPMAPQNRCWESVDLSTHLHKKYGGYISS